MSSSAHASISLPRASRIDAPALPRDLKPVASDSSVSFPPGFVAATDPAALPRIEMLLRDRLGPEKLGRYLRGGRAVQLNELGEVVVSVPSPLVAGIVEKDFAEIIRIAACEVLGRVAVPLRITVVGQLAPTVPAALVRGGDVPMPTESTAQTAPGAPGVAEEARKRRLAPVPLRYRLADLIVTPFNRLAYESIRRHATGEAGMGVLLIHGSTGLGKTHMLHALAAEVSAETGGRGVMVTTGEQFINDYVAACKSNRSEDFRRRHRRVDLLAIDDAHAIAGRTGSQNELAATIDAVLQRGGRVALTASSAPRSIAELSESLVSRFSSGMVAGINPLDGASIQRIIAATAERRGLRLEPEALALLTHEAQAPAARGASPRAINIRDLEGMVTKIEAVHRLLPNVSYGSASGRVGVIIVQHALNLAGSGGATGGSGGPGSASRSRAVAGSVYAGARAVRMNDIVDHVCRSLNVEAAELAGRGRHVRVVLARAIATWLARKLTSMSYPEIARAIGRPNHSTVITAHRRLDAQIASGLCAAELTEPVKDLCDRLLSEMRGR